MFAARGRPALVAIISIISTIAAAVKLADIAAIAYVRGMSGETAYPVREALGFAAGQWERVRTFRFEHRFATEAEAVRRLLDLGMEAVDRRLLPAHEDREGKEQPPSPGEGGAST